MVIVNSLLLGSIVLMLARVYQPWVDRTEGQVLSTFRIPLRARVRLQRYNAYALVVLLLLGAVGGWLSPAFELLSVGLAFVVLMLPVRYTLTDAGVILGRTPIRHWTEFSAVELKPGRARLKGVDDWRDMEVWLPRSRDDVDNVALARRCVAAASASSLKPATQVPRHVGAVRAKASSAR